MIWRLANIQKNAADASTWEKHTQKALQQSKKWWKNS